VLDEHNVELEWQMHSSRIQFLAPYTFLVEKLAVSKSLFTLTVSGTDKENLSRLYKTPKEKFFIIPNGVDSSRFSNLSPSPILRSKLGFSPDDKIVFFHGSLDVKPNYEAAKTIIQDIAPKIKGAKFLIAGSKPPAWLRAKSERSKNITLIGYVRQVEHYIKAADVCIAPLKTGSGTRLKIIEYASSAKPIVATYKATEGLPFVNNVSALLFENANEDFSEGLDRVLSDGTLAQRLSSNAKEISMKFDWKEISRVLYDKYMSLFRDNKDRPHKIVFES
jgi:glycosyltransferase involved in cell wall biosynthesis